MEGMEASGAESRREGYGGVRVEKQLEPRRENAGTCGAQRNLSRNDFPAFLVALKMACSGMVASLTSRDEEVQDENVPRILQPKPVALMLRPKTRGSGNEGSLNR